VSFAATVECANRALPVKLRDLSEHGALVESDDPLSVESEIWFSRDGVRVHGHVVWAEGNQAGIVFSCALQSEVVLRYMSPS
jgi:hypothetical protein